MSHASPFDEMLAHLDALDSSDATISEIMEQARAHLDVAWIALYTRDDERAIASAGQGEAPRLSAAQRAEGQRPGLASAGVDEAHALVALWSAPRGWSERDLADLERAAAHVARERERAHHVGALRALHQRQARLDEEQRQLVSRISHDFRGPLRNIRQLADWLVEDEAEKLSAEGQQSLNLLHERALFAEEMLQTMVRYTRVSAPMPITTLSLAQEMPRILSAARDGEAAPALTFEAPTEEVTLAGAALRDVLLGVARFITWHAREAASFKLFIQDGALRGEVCSDGPELPERLREAYFGAFSESKYPERVQLTLARQRARAHGAELRCLDPASHGALLELVWPLSEAQDT